MDRLPLLIFYDKFRATVMVLSENSEKTFLLQSRVRKVFQQYLWKISAAVWVVGLNILLSLFHRLTFLKQSL